MKFAVSNIAWSHAERLDAYAILRDHGFTGLEIAPGLFFAGEADPFKPSAEAVRTRLAELDRFGLTLVSAQSLLFGVEGAELFGAPAGRERLEAGLVRAIELAGRLGIGNLVFGSPRQRIIPPGLGIDAVSLRMKDVFRPLGELAAANKTCIALEPNAPAYGTNFMTTLDETIGMVQAVDHPSVTLNFDTGALYMAEEHGAVAARVVAAAPFISHVHVSAAELAPAPVSQADARTLIEALGAIGYDRAVSIEMKAAPDALGTLKASVARLRSAFVARQST